MKIHKHRNGKITIDGEGMMIKLKDGERISDLVRVTGDFNPKDFTLTNYVLGIESNPNKKHMSVYRAYVYVAIICIFMLVAVIQTIRLDDEIQLLKAQVEKSKPVVD